MTSFKCRIIHIHDLLVKIVPIKLTIKSNRCSLTMADLIDRIDLFGTLKYQVFVSVSEKLHKIRILIILFHKVTQIDILYE